MNRSSILGAALLSNVLITMGLASATKPTLVLKNDSLSLGFDSQRLALVSLKDPKTGHEFLESLPETPILWALNMEKPDGTPFQLMSNAPSKRWIKHSSEGGKVTLVWSGLEVAGEANAMEVKVTVSLAEGADRSYWSMEVDNQSKSTLMDVRFPYISGISKEGQPAAAIPRNNWGALERDVHLISGSYPSSVWPMQFLALLEKETGLYLGFEDSRATFKYFHLKPGDYFTFTNFVENASVPGNDYASPGPVAIGVCGADWWKASKMFRQWALQQSWTRRGPLKQRSDISEAAKQIGIWFNEYLTSQKPEVQIAEVAAAKDFYKVPVALQLYTWHVPEFDTAHPDIFPGRPPFKGVVSSLTSTGEIVVPYINGRVQDLGAPSIGEASPWMAKKRDGKPYTEIYGSPSVFAVMCPATGYWQQVMKGMVDRLVGEYGVNGIYWDQVAAAEPVQCYDPSHGHPLGGGSHWADGYRKMLEAMRAIKTKEGVPVLHTTENNTDCYMDVLDAFLLWTPRYAAEIPMMSAVYSGYTIYFGTNAQVEKEGGLAPFAMYVGRDILWGTQPGWLHIEMSPERAAYLRDVAQLRHAGLKFFQFGELVDDLKPSNEIGIAKGTWRKVDGSGFEEVHLPAAMGAVWKSDEGTLGVVIANLTGEKQEFSYTVNPASYGLSTVDGKGWSLRQIKAGGTVDLGSTEDKQIIRSEALEPWAIHLVEIAPLVRPSTAMKFSDRTLVD